MTKSTGLCPWGGCLNKPAGVMIHPILGTLTPCESHINDARHLKSEPHPLPDPIDRAAEDWKGLFA